MTRDKAAEENGAVIAADLRALDEAIDVSVAAAAMGRLGGRAGAGKAKRRPKAHYRRIGKLGGKARKGHKAPPPDQRPKRLGRPPKKPKA